MFVEENDWTEMNIEKTFNIKRQNTIEDLIAEFESEENDWFIIV